MTDLISDVYNQVVEARTERKNKTYILYSRSVQKIQIAVLQVVIYSDSEL